MSSCIDDAALWTEYICLSMLAQMAEVSQSIARLSELPDVHSDVHPTASALARLTVEGLAYLNYMLTDETEWRARWFAAGDIMWREYFLDSGRGKRWRRYHGPLVERQEPVLDPIHDICIAIPGSQVLYLDQFERDWLQSARAYLESLGIAMRTPPAATAPVGDWRNWWNSHKCTFKGMHDSYRPWRERCDLWNRSKQQPMGVRFGEAVRDGDLVVYIQREAAAANLAKDIQVRSWVSAYGWGVGSQLAHFSPSRCLSPWPGFAKGACLTAFFSLWLAGRVLKAKSQYEWAAKLDERILECFGT